MMKKNVVLTRIAQNWVVEFHSYSSENTSKRHLV